MNAIRKATEHKRKPPRPRVSEAGRRVLEFLDKYGAAWISPLHIQLWRTRSGRAVYFRLSTIEASEHRGCVDGDCEGVSDMTHPVSCRGDHGNNKN